MGRQRQLPQVAPFFVDAGLPGHPVASDDGPRAGLTVIRFPNSHLVYALTWYGLALMVVGAAWTVARYERRRAAAGSAAQSSAHESSTR
jgi:surfeit locus 1 family protein